MKLYTINATWVRPGQDTQTQVELNTTFEGVVARILSAYDIDGFTIYKAQGYWQGVAEKSYKIEIATEHDVASVVRICEKLRDEYSQDAVMLTYPDNNVEFI